MCKTCKTESKGAGNWVTSAEHGEHKRKEFRESSISRTRGRGGRARLLAQARAHIARQGVSKEAKTFSVKTKEKVLDTVEQETPMDLDLDLENPILAAPSPPTVSSPPTIESSSSDANSLDILPQSTTSLRRSARTVVIERRKKQDAERVQRAALAAFKKAEAARRAAEEEESIPLVESNVTETYIQSALEEAIVDLPENPIDEDTADDSALQVPREVELDTNLLPPTDIPIKQPRRSPLKAYDESHSNAFIRVLIILVALLHTKHHVPFRACNFILFSLGTVLLSMGFITTDMAIPQSLQTVLKRLNLEDRFTVFPICARCHRIFRTDISPDSLCPDCKLSLFKPVHQSVFRRLTGSMPPPPPPSASAPIQTLSSVLTDFFSRPGMENELDGWRRTEHKEGEYKDICDGDVWRTSIGPDGKPFFDRSVEHEIRLGVTMSFDWYVLFFNRHRSY